MAFVSQVADAFDAPVLAPDAPPVARAACAPDEKRQSWVLRQLREVGPPLDPASRHSEVADAGSTLDIAIRRDLTGATGVEASFGTPSRFVERRLHEHDGLPLVVRCASAAPEVRDACISL
jgi:hypothetical protein